MAERRLLLTAAEVGSMIGMTAGWVYAEARAGRVPHVRLGRSVRFRREAVEGWIRDLEHRSVERDPSTRRAARPSRTRSSAP